MNIKGSGIPIVDVGNFNPASGEIGFISLFDVPVAVPAKVFVGQTIHLGLQQSGQLVPVTLVDETDLVTEELSVVSPTIEISKNGASYAAMNDGTWSEVGQGDYTVRFDDVDTGDTGFILLRVIKSGVSAETKVLVVIDVSASERRRDYVRGRSDHRQRR